MKMTHRITITMLAHSAAVAEEILHKAGKLLANSKFAYEGRVDRVDADPAAYEPPTIRTHGRFKRIGDAITGIEEITERPRSAPKHRLDEKLSPAEVDAILDSELNPMRPRLYLHVSGESLFYGPEPFAGKFDTMRRVTVSGLHPHYGNPLLVAQDFREVFTALGIEVLNS